VCCCHAILRLSLGQTDALPLGSCHTLLMGLGSDMCRMRKIMLLPQSLSIKFDGILDSITLMPLTARTMAAEPRLTPCRNSATQSPGPSRPQQGCTTRRPANQQVRGRLTLKASPITETKCISDGVLGIPIASSKAVVAQVLVEELAADRAHRHVHGCHPAQKQNVRRHLPEDGRACL